MARKGVFDRADRRQAERGREAAGPRGDDRPVCKRIGISDQTFFRWRIEYGSLKEDEAHRLKALESENMRLKRIVADQALDISMLKDLRKEQMVSPSRRRDAVAYLRRRHPVSERRACRLVGPHHSSDR